VSELGGANGRAVLRDMARDGTIEMVLFDLDGTLIHSGVAFGPYRERLGITGDILAGIQELPEGQQSEKWDIIMEYEHQLGIHAQPAPGAGDLLSFLRKKGIRTGVITRSTADHAERMLTDHGLMVDTFIGRGDSRPKPHPDGIHLLLDRYGIGTDHAVMVGDFIWDLLAARNAGVLSVLVMQDHSRPHVKDADVVVDSLGEFLEILRSTGDRID